MGSTLQNEMEKWKHRIRSWVCIDVNAELFLGDIETFDQHGAEMEENIEQIASIRVPWCRHNCAHLFAVEQQRRRQYGNPNIVLVMYNGNGQ